MKFKVYDVTRDKQGTAIFQLKAECETWRETHPFRRLQKYQRTLPDKRPITTAVYDARTDAFLCSP